MRYVLDAMMAVGDYEMPISVELGKGFLESVEAFRKRYDNPSYKPICIRRVEETRHEETMLMFDGDRLACVTNMDGIPV